MLKTRLSLILAENPKAQREDCQSFPNILRKLVRKIILEKVHSRGCLQVKRLTLESLS